MNTTHEALSVGAGTNDQQQPTISGGGLLEHAAQFIAEHAPTILKLAGVSAILAKSFARIFFRNAINVGLPALECDTDSIQTGDELEVDLSEGVVRNLTQDMTLSFTPLPPVMISILEDGGLADHIKKHGDFRI